MVAAIRQVVIVKPGGVVELRSSKLKAGTEAEVIVLLPDRAKRRNGILPKSNGSRSAKSRKIPFARMTKQTRGDIAEVARIQKAIREGREKLIPWEQVKREINLT